jgi:hypothetical protein
MSAGSTLPSEHPTAPLDSPSTTSLNPMVLVVKDFPTPRNEAPRSEEPPNEVMYPPNWVEVGELPLAKERIKLVPEPFRRLNDAVKQYQRVSTAHYR